MQRPGETHPSYPRLALKQMARDGGMEGGRRRWEDGEAGLDLEGLGVPWETRLV